MAEVTYISSIGLRMIAMLANYAERNYMSFALCSPSKEVDFVFNSSGFDQLVSVAETETDAYEIVVRRDDEV